MKNKNIKKYFFNLGNSHGCLLLIYKLVVLGANIDEVFSAFDPKI